MKESTYTPADVTALLGIKQDVLRDRRRRGFHYFGKQLDSGRFKYDAKDMLGLAASSVLEKQVGNANEAERLGYWISAELAKHIGLVHPASTWGPGLVGRNGASDVYTETSVNMTAAVKYAICEHGVNPILTNNPAFIADVDLMATVVNIHALADSLPDDLKQRLIEDEREQLGVSDH